MAEKSLNAQLKDARKLLEDAEMQVRVDVAGLRRSLEQRNRRRKEVERILELLAKKAERIELLEEK